MLELKVLIAVAALAFGGLGLTRLLGADRQGAAFVLAAVFVTVAVAVIPHEFEDRVGMTVVFGLITVGILIYHVGWRSVTGGAAGLFVVGCVGAWFWFFERHRLAARKLLRRTASRLGWKMLRVDHALLHRVRLILPEVANRRRALYAAIEGVIDGVPLTLVTGRLAPQVWLSRLPFALPLIPLDGQAPSAVVEWRIERDDILLRLRPVADPQSLAAHAQQAASLIGELPLDAMRPRAVDPATVPGRTVMVDEPWRTAVITGVVAAVLAGLFLLCCGGWNAFVPGHETGAHLMLGIGGGAILLAVVAFVLLGGKTARRP